MESRFPLPVALPPAAEPAVRIVRVLENAGHQALLAGGCVRDLLLGRAPEDFDVATEAPPELVCKLLRPTRRVGVKFGVVLAKSLGRWVEVATFRSDGPYLDGRHPSSVTLTDAEHDALRRDFTVNGMFLDALHGTVIDFVGGRGDLESRIIRAIGEPAARFNEDYLRLLRAVRFAARLAFELEPATRIAIETLAPLIAKVAPERVRDELAKMLTHPTRAGAWRLMRASGLHAHLWPAARWTLEHLARIDALLPRLPADASFELAFAVILGDRTPGEIDEIGRALTFSNEERERVLWLVASQEALDDPDRPTLAQLKQLLAGPVPLDLLQLAHARRLDLSDASERTSRLRARVDAIPPSMIQPPPLVTGGDLLARGLPPGPAYKAILDALYTQQLDEVLTTRDAALARLDEMLTRR